MKVSVATFVVAVFACGAAFLLLDYAVMTAQGLSLFYQP